MIRTHWRSIACALAACMAAVPASAQRVTLRGQVVDAASGQPVPAAVIEVMPRHESAISDTQGRFTVRTIKIHYDGASMRVTNTIKGSAGTVTDPNEFLRREYRRPWKLT